MNEQQQPIQPQDGAPATDPVPTEPVGSNPPGAAADGSPGLGAATVATGPTRARWLLAIGAVALIAAITIGALVLFGAQSAAPELAYVPGDSAVVAELRMDLPGDQMQHLGNLLAHFPGFQDQATLGDKIDMALERLVEGMDAASIDYATDVKPWLGGPVFAAMRAEALDRSGADSERGVIVATTNGAVSCSDVFRNETPTTESYRGLELVVGASGAAACALDDRRAILGDIDSVKAALDARANGSGMDRSAAYAAARAALGGDRLVTVFVDGAAVAARMPQADPSLGVDLSAFTGAIPDWFMLGMRAEDDAIIVDTAAAPVTPTGATASLLPAPAGHASAIAGLVPADSLLFVEVQGAGVALQNAVTSLSQMPEVAEALGMLDGLGGAGALVGWIQDAGVAIGLDGDSPRAAVVLLGADEASVQQQLRSLTAVLGLAALGEGVEVAQSTISGVAVTTVTVTDVGALLPPGTVPGDPAPVDAPPVSFSLAASGRALLLTVGDGAMEHVLAATGDASLANDAAFRAAVAVGLPNSSMTFYAAAGSALDLASQFMTPEELATYQSDVAPYLEPFEAIAATSSTDDNASRSRFVITLSQP